MDPMMLIFLVLIFAVFYFLLIRPQRKRQSEHRMLIEGLQKGDKVITIGGIYGEIDSIDEQELILRVEDGSRLKLLRTSIMGIQQSE
ncbi:MAG: preprotein translocase subunit YajC [Dehalococcoidia bacterium]|nr:preprotein translocase subunit YajC [Dehalococcoidia bacterium]MCL0059422.1 preprotein translocase subunit YajC [Dehalococcoidia bacterium]MCL0098320.1 preprotein translocase subunit YajC [Dehalococcoidia bacterium]MCL0103343.1 preprotein translocase subunit YajC [Dehalococcoidia bacterium]